MIHSIKNQNILKIEDNNMIYYGSNQDWFTRRWQRMSGCGPSAVANVIYYLTSTKAGSTYDLKLTKTECLNLMNEIWNYVTPGLGGVSSTTMLCKGVQKYVNYKKLNIKMDYIDIPKKITQRPNILQVAEFIKRALEKDSPVAFLNLEHGSIYELDSWHWVTIISLEQVSEETSFVSILDGGMVKRINLSEWLKTTKLGGGFVSFDVTEYNQN